MNFDAVWRLVTRTGQYAVRIVGIEEKGLKIQHEKDNHPLLSEITCHVVFLREQDGYEEVVKQRVSRTNFEGCLVVRSLSGR